MDDLIAKSSGIDNQEPCACIKCFICRAFFKSYE